MSPLFGHLTNVHTCGQGKTCQRMNKSSKIRQKNLCVYIVGFITTSYIIVVFFNNICFFFKLFIFETLLKVISKT